MKLHYEDLVSGDPIPINGVGHFRSPQLKELKPTTGIGVWKYRFYINVISWEQEDLIKYLRYVTGKKMKALDKAQNLSVFDIVSIVPNAQTIFTEALGFFMLESLEWDNDSKSFIVYSSGKKEQIGSINRDNFEVIRDIVLQLNYVNLGNKTMPTKFASKEAEALWQKAQEHLKRANKSHQKDEKMALGNIISKLCAAPTGYTLLNIYELTVFQLYDQFFQYGYLRAMDINEMAFSNHGGKDFDIQAWLKPILN